MKFKSLIVSLLFFVFFSLTTSYTYASTYSFTTDPCPADYVVNLFETECTKFEKIPWGVSTGNTGAYEVPHFDAAGNVYLLEFDIYADQDHANILKYPVSGGSPTIAATINDEEYGYTIEDFFVSPDGTMYVATYYNEVIRIDAEGTKTTYGPTTSYSNPQEISQIAVDSNGDIFVLETYNSRIRKIDVSEDTVSTYVSYDSIISPTQILFDDSNNLYVSYYVLIYNPYPTPYVRGITKYTPAMMEFQIVPEVPTNSYSDKMVLGYDGYLYISYAFDNYIKKYDLDGNLIHTFLYPEYTIVQGVDANSYIYLSNFWYIDEVNSDSISYRTDPNGLTHEYFGGTLGPASNNLFVHNYSNHSIERVGLAEESFDILLDTSWIQSGGKTSAAVSMIEFNGKLYQAVRGNSDPYYIYMRSTSDGVFDGSASEENWSASGVNGKTSDQPSLAVFNNRLYISVKGNSGNVFTKSMGTGGDWDLLWNDNGGATGTPIGMTTVNFGDGDRLYQVIRGRSTNNIYLRYTTDGMFDGGTGEAWELINGQTPNAIAITSLNGKMYMSVRGNSGEIWNRYTNDGIWDGDESAENFVQNGGKTSLAPALAVFDGKVYQVIKGNSSNYIYTRYSVDGDNWYGWVNYGGQTPNRIEMTSFGGKLYQSVRGNSGNIFYRTLELPI